MNPQAHQLKSITFPDQKELEVQFSEAPEDTALNMIWAAMDKGVDIYHAAVAGLVASTGCKWIAISSLLDSKDRVEVLAMWEDSDFASCFEYDLEGTPCDLVTKTENIIVFDKVADKFPHDEYLQDMGVEDYIGLSFKNDQGEIAGHISIMDNEPFEELPSLEKTLGVVSALVGLEAH
ncbi:MAG: GAF domain-containing protein [Kangiellaceae bacterium]|nr:GAF domain-containing protein [Kangiellaceae bacterium]